MTVRRRKWTRVCAAPTCSSSATSATSARTRSPTSTAAGKTHLLSFLCPLNHTQVKKTGTHTHRGTHPMCFLVCTHMQKLTVHAQIYTQSKICPAFHFWVSNLNLQPAIPYQNSCQLFQWSEYHLEMSLYTWKLKKTQACLSWLKNFRIEMCAVNWSRQKHFWLTSSTGVQMAIWSVMRIIRKILGYDSTKIRK